MCYANQFVKSFDVDKAIAPTSSPTALRLHKIMDKYAQYLGDGFHDF